MLSFQDIIARLHHYWATKGCAILQGLDSEVGAGTSHPATFLRALGPEPWQAAYVQASRRPKDGRYGQNPNRLGHYYQYQVALKPAPDDVQDLFLKSLQILGLDLQRNDIRFVEDDWENPTLGAWGLGWEVWLNGMEITQFTYFQQVGGLNCSPVLSEITYGLERLAMALQQKENVFDLVWAHTDTAHRPLLYGDIFQQHEVEQATYHFEALDATFCFDLFQKYEAQAQRLIAQTLVLPAYEYVLKCAHIFNQLEAGDAISVTERAHYIARIRHLSKSVAQAYYLKREQLNFPLLKA